MKLFVGTIVLEHETPTIVCGIKKEGYNPAYTKAIRENGFFMLDKNNQKHSFTVKDMSMSFSITEDINLVIKVDDFSLDTAFIGSEIIPNE